MIRTWIAAAVLTTLAVQQGEAQAQAQDYPLLAMLRVEVVGIAPQPGLGIDREVLPYSVQSANSKTIRQAQAGNLTDFMARDLNGINVNEISGSPFQNDITFRGFRASPVLGASQGISVYLDGVRVNEPFGDVVNWDMLPEAAVGSMLLVPGSNPLYGLNTLGGAVALTTKTGRSDPGLEAEFSASGSSQHRFDLTYGKRFGSWHALVAATAFDDAGWRDHSAGKLGNVFFKLGHARGDTEWSVAALGGRSRLRGNGLLPDALYEDNRRAAYTFPDQTRNRLAQATFNLRQGLDGGAELSATAYTRNSRRDTVNGDVSDVIAEAILNTTSTRQHSEGVSLNWSATKGAHQIAVGATIDRNRVSFAQFEQTASFTADRGVIADSAAEREPASSVTGAARMLGVYGSDTWTIRPGSNLTFSARFNHARVGNTLTNDSGQLAPETFTYRKLNPAIGFAQEVGGATVFANIAQSNRVPTVIELGCADPAQPCRLPVGLQSDPYLEQVVSRTIEAGLRWHAGDASLSASVYRTANRNDILFLSAGSTQQGYFSNFAGTRHQGLDLTASKRFGKLDARISYNYLEALFDADGQLFTGARDVSITRGTRIAGLPRHTFKLGLDWKPSPAVSIGADAQAISSLVTQGNEDGAHPGWGVRGYGMLNLRASYRLDAHWELFARITNVGDRRYESYGAVATDLFPHGRQVTRPGDAEHARFVAPGAPRSMAAGIRATF
jgi:outer membrane receptor protein involved in Fe transport